MNKSVTFALIVLVIVGVVFGIQYQIENYNSNNNTENKVPEEKLEDILPTLTIPSFYDTLFDGEALFYDLDSIDVTTMSNAMKLSLVVNQLHSKEYDRNNINSTTKLNGKDVKEYYQKLYGNIQYIPETFTFFESESCERVYEYNSEEDYYIRNFPACGGNTGPFEWRRYIKKDKETKEGNLVYIDYYVATYKKVLEDELVEPWTSEPVEIYDRIFEEKIYMGKEINDSVVNELIKQNQISKYRLTYEKQSDGKYYFKAGSWLENTLS